MVHPLLTSAFATVAALVSVASAPLHSGHATLRSSQPARSIVLRADRRAVCRPGARVVVSLHRRRLLNRRLPRHWKRFSVHLSVPRGRRVLRARVSRCSLKRATVSLLGAQHASGNPFAGQTWSVDPHSNAAKTAAQWRAAGRTADADQLRKIASEPGAAWFGDWNGDVKADVASRLARDRAGGATQSVLVAYRAGLRAACTTSSQAQYRTWIRQFAAGIGDSRAAVVLEPDGLAGLPSECKSAAAQRAQLAMFADAVSVLAARPNVAVYIDAGNKGWNPPATMARRLAAAGVAKARGIALNVSNFDATANEAGYGKQIVAALRMADKHLLIDTSRNGQGANGVWCNPAGRGLGHRPTAHTGDPAVDAYFWVKTPGESDGNWSGCDQAGSPPSAGTWWPGYALGLAQRAALG